MKKKIKSLLLFIIMFILLIGNFVNAQLRNSEVIYICKLKIKLNNIDISDYTIELINTSLDEIFEKQDGNDEKEHDFAIATTNKPEEYLTNYEIKIRSSNDEIIKVEPIVFDRLVAIDEDKNDSIYNYVYEIGVEKIPTWLNSMIKIIIIICIIIIVLIVGIISLKKYKKRIK